MTDYVGLVKLSARVGGIDQNVLPDRVKLFAEVGGIGQTFWQNGWD